MYYPGQQIDYCVTQLSVTGYAAAYAVKG
jgi:hypothetical protein